MSLLRKTKRKRGGLWILLIAVIGIFVAVAISAFLSVYGLMITHYKVSTDKMAEPIRIVHLTDLHNSEFGANNEKIIEKVKENTPDLILITGDLLNENEERIDIAANLISGLSEVCSVYVSYGNHEVGHEKRYGSDLKQTYSEAGATVLEYDWQDVEVKGEKLRIGGIYGYCLPEKHIEGSEVRKQEAQFLNQFQDTERYRLLMCHMPLAWIKIDSLEEWDIDCILCGHTHGGQVRFPIIGGLWAPDEGWFPGKEAGIYYSIDQSKAMILSRGLGSTERIPRINNVPEIMVLDIVPR